MTQRIALDLYCGGGGVALGLQRAGFRVVGVDINPRHAGVYPGEFVHGDALMPPFNLADFDLVWASPPCQLFSIGSNYNTKITVAVPKVNLIPETRALLAGHPYTVIENVPNAPIACDLALTAPALGLCRLVRRRHFELSFPALQPPLTARAVDYPQRLVVTKSMSHGSMFYSRKKAGMRGIPSRLEVLTAMGYGDVEADAYTYAQIGESIPPVYAEYIGKQAIAAMEGRAQGQGRLW